MSFFSLVNPACPQCATPIELELVMSVNADRRPDFRAAILDGTFQRARCPACGTLIRPEPAFILQDVARGQWLTCEPAERLAHWRTLEAQVYASWDKAFGSHAPSSVQALGAGMSPRVAFGWPAVVEKVLCVEHGLDDVRLELLKLAILRTGGSVPMSDTVELRLVEVQADRLTLAWLDARSEVPLEQLELDRAALDDMADPAWDHLRAQLSEGLYVDLNRLLADVGAAAG